MRKIALKSNKTFLRKQNIWLFQNVCRINTNVPHFPTHNIILTQNAFLKHVFTFNVNKFPGNRKIYKSHA